MTVLGNRETYATPGMQWMSVGSGVYHAEGGGDSPDGLQGFQIWINVPADRKMDPPRYGTVEPDKLPLVACDGSSSSSSSIDSSRSAASSSSRARARVLAGNALNTSGPFLTTQPIQMIDFELQPGGKVHFDVASGLDTAILFVYQGQQGMHVENAGFSEMLGADSVVLFDASDDSHRSILLSVPDSHAEGANAMLFAGKKLKQPIAWRGPIVMNTQSQIEQTFAELRDGSFPPVRVPWNYKRIANRPSTGL